MEVCKSVADVKEVAGVGEAAVMVLSRSDTSGRQALLLPLLGEHRFVGIILTRVCVRYGIVDAFALLVISKLCVWQRKDNERPQK